MESWRMADGLATASSWEPTDFERAKLDGVDVRLIRMRHVRWDPDNPNKVPTTSYEYEVELPDRSRKNVDGRGLTDLSGRAPRR